MFFGLRGMLDIAQDTQRLSALYFIWGGVLKGHRVPRTALTVRCRNGAVLSSGASPVSVHFLRTMLANRAPLATNK